MNIGILTFHCGYNFGANLQALATVASLRSIGHYPVILDFWPRELEFLYKKNKPTVQGAAHKIFVRKHLPLSRRCLSGEEVAGEIDRLELDGVIIGADAVLQHWPLVSRMNLYLSRKTLLRLGIRPVRYELNYPNPYWGEFLDYTHEPVKAAIVSASCENTDPFFIRGKTKREMAQKLHAMSYISVRDESTARLVRHVSHDTIKPGISADPVFSLNRHFPELPGEQEFRERLGLPDKYILVSFHSNAAVSKDWISEFAALASENGFTCVAMAMPEGIRYRHSLSHTLDIPLDPLDWFCAIRYSAGYVGEKMHPIVVALHNVVPFFSFDKYGIVHFKTFVVKKSSKIYQLLERVGFLDHYASIGGRLAYKPPSAASVWQKISSFDNERCRRVSEMMFQSHQGALRNALDSFEK